MNAMTRNDLIEYIRGYMGHDKTDGIYDLSTAFLPSSLSHDLVVRTMKKAKRMKTTSY